MEAAYDGVHLADAGELAGVAGDVDDAGVAAAGEHDETSVAYVEDEGLVVEDQRIGLPLLAFEGLFAGHPLFEVGGTGHFAGHERAGLEQEGRLWPLDDLEAGVDHGPLAGGGHLDRVAAGDDRSAP